MPALMPYVHSDFNVISTWEAGNSLIKCHSFPFIEMQGGTNSLTLFAFHCSTAKAFFGVSWIVSELPATFLLYLCCVPETVLHCVFLLTCIFSIFRLLSCFLLLRVKLRVLGPVKEEEGKGQGAAHLPTRNISSSGTRLCCFQVICTLRRALAPFTIPRLLLQPSTSGAGWMKLNKRVCLFYQHIW